MLTDLADACRRSGLPVVEVKGWQTRGTKDAAGRPRSLSGAPKTIVCHHTATSSKAVGDYPTLNLVRDGRSDLPGPLAQLGLGRNGTVYVIAAGRANHAGATFQSRQGNGYSIGIEAEHPGGSTPWTDKQYDAYARLCKALVDHYGIPVPAVEGHKEVAAPKGRKPDPNFDMNTFRRDVSSTTIAPHQEDDDMTPTESKELFYQGEQLRAIAALVVAQTRAVDATVKAVSTQVQTIGQAVLEGASVGSTRHRELTALLAAIPAEVAAAQGELAVAHSAAEVASHLGVTIHVKEPK